MTRSSFCTTFIGPSASTLPSCSTVTVRAMRLTKSMSCSTTMIEWLPFEFEDQFRGAVRLGIVMPATGSSSRISSGSCTNSMPISSHCFCPCDNSPAAAAPGRRADGLQCARDQVALGGRKLRQQRRTDALIRLHCEFKIFEHRVFLEYRRLLELAADAEPRNFRFRSVRDRSLPKKALPVSVASCR